MNLRVDPDSPRNPAAMALLRASHAFQNTLYAPEDVHFLSIDELGAPDVLFFTARRGDTVLGTAALALRDGYAEVKSMFVDPVARGQGIAAALLDRLVAEAQARGLILRLETGPLNTEAMRLYERHGFARRGAFGAYADSPASVFMEKPLIRRLRAEDDMRPVHALLVQAFAFMAGVIDPPSSMDRMTSADLARDAAQSELWVIGDQPLACVILTPRADTLYLGKLAVAQSHRGRGLSRLLVDHAAARAGALGLPSVTLQVRVELAGNLAAFQAMGFSETGRTAHPGHDRPTSITLWRPV